MRDDQDLPVRITANELNLEELVSISAGQPLPDESHSAAHHGALGRRYAANGNPGGGLTIQRLAGRPIGQSFHGTRWETPEEFSSLFRYRRKLRGRTSLFEYFGVKPGAFSAFCLAGVSAERVVRNPHTADSSSG